LNGQPQFLLPHNIENALFMFLTTMKPDEATTFVKAVTSQWLRSLDYSHLYN
jgi:hypothetical protein